MPEQREHEKVEDPLGYWTIFCDKHDQWEQMTDEEIETWLNKPRRAMGITGFPY